MPAPVLQFKRGNAGVAGTVPALRPGEPAISLNNFDFFIGIDTSVANNKFFGSHRYWEREDGTNSLKLKLVSNNGSESINLRAPTGLGATFTYTLPATGVGNSGKVLSTNEAGVLSWIDSVNQFSVEQIVIGIGTFSNNVGFTSTTDNTLGDENTGAVQLDGGMGIAKNLTVKQNLHVGGYSEFVGVVTFKGGTINIGDDTGDNINVGGEFTSGLYPNSTNTYDLGDSTRQWRHASFAGIGTFSTGLLADGVRLGIGGNGVVDTSSGPLYLDSASGTTIINDHLDVFGDLDVQGNVYIGGTTVTLRGTDVFIENKDIVLGYTTAISPNDTTANHAGVAIASTVGTPLVSFSASGINTLPDTYKQMMWFQSGTLGFATDAFGFNYGVAIGTTTMANGVRLAVGSGITMSDNSISATNGYFTNISAGSVTGTISTATRATTVDTTSTGTNTNYHLVFTDNATSTTGATMRVDAGIYYNPSSNYLYSSLFVGDVAAAAIKAGDTTTAMTLFSTTGDVAFNGNIRANDGTVALTLSPTTGDVTFNNSITVPGTITGTATTATRATTVDTTGTSTNADYYVTFVDTLAGQTGETVRVGAGLSVNPSTGDVKTTGKLSVGNPGALTSYIKAGGGSDAMYLYANGDVSFQQKVIADNIRSSSNSNNTITLNGLDATFASGINVIGIATVGTFKLNGTSGIGITGISASTTLAENSNSYLPTQAAVKAYVDAVDVTLGLNADTGGPSTVSTAQTLTISGTANEVETSVAGQTVTIGLPNAVVVGTSLSAPTLRTGTIQSSNTGATVLTLTGNDATFADDLTVNGNLYVQGSTTQINTTTLAVEDRTIELGRLDTNLTQPTTTTWDLAVLFNYGDGAAKKAGLVWEASGATKRFQFTTDVNPGTDGSDSQTNLPSFSVSNFAPIEIGQLWVTDCAGTSQVISCTGTERFLENITVDAGSF